MDARGKGAIEARLQALEDRLAIFQVVCAYGYAVDGCNAEAVGDLYAEDGVYDVGDTPAFEGRDEVAALASNPGHFALVENGVAHLSTLPYVVIEDDRAVATCHTLVSRYGEDGFKIWRISACRIELSRQGDGVWRINHRQNHLLNGDRNGPALLARLKEGPSKGGRTA